MPLDITNINQFPEDDSDPFATHNAQPSSIMFPVGERKTGWQTRAGGYQPIHTHKAIIRIPDSADPSTINEDSVHVLSVVGSNYKLVHNRELFGRVEQTMRKVMPAHTLDGVQIKDRVSGWGRMCYREYIFPNIKCNLGRGAKSDIAFRTIVQNGYGGSALRIHSGAIDFFCTNGIISGEHQSSYNKHTSGLIVAGVDRIIERALETFASNQTKWKQWTETPIKHSAAMELFKELASSEKLRENLNTQYLRESDTRGNTLWSVYSALTYYASHADGDFRLRKTTAEQDTVASTMLQRELNVAKWIESPAWKQLELVG
jgi:hypothetical protein